MTVGVSGLKYFEIQDSSSLNNLDLVILGQHYIYYESTQIDLSFELYIKFIEESKKKSF